MQPADVLTWSRTMIRRYGLAFRALLAIADGLTAVAALFVAIAVRFGTASVDQVPGITFSDPSLAVATYAILWPFVLWTQGLYRHRARWTIRREVGDLLRAVLIYAAIVVSLLFAFKYTDASRLVLLVLFPLLAIGALATRLLLHRALVVLRRNGRNTRFMLILGTTPQSQAFADMVDGHDSLGLQVIGHLAEGVAQGSYITRPTLGTLDQIEDIFHSRVIDEVAICLPVADWSRIDEIVRLCEEEGKIVRIPMYFLGNTISAGRVEEFGGVPIYSFLSGPDRVVGLLAKRALDIIGGTILAIILTPAMLAISVWIRSDSPGPITFRQRRVGLHGRTFEVWKFRTMIEGAEERLEDLRGQNEIRGNAFKMTSDPRVTRVGRWLRKTSLDELPQLMNVLRGEMSLVGPRPPLPSEVAGYDVWHRRRLSMRPGMTGLWQVTARRESDFDRWVEADLEYIDRWSFWLDLKIMALTVPAVLGGGGR
jgi:exopolysaccharide biosynthesis polyprenyl glycosylphosphotransferase